MYGFEAMTFNIHGGYLEAIVRGYRSGLLTAADYNNLCQCETLDDIKMHLSATEYGPYLQNEPSPLQTTTIVEKCNLKLVDEYKHTLCQATEPLSTFLEYIIYGHMIDNVVLIVTGTLHERDVQELLEKCHPLGMFDIAQNMRELYRLVLLDTPLAPYFSECITSEGFVHIFGLALSSIGEYRRAEEAHMKSIQLDPSFLEAWAHLTQ
ncbi:unnamed protein product [Camellia sinensis]